MDGRKMKKSMQEAKRNHIKETILFIFISLFIVTSAIIGMINLSKAQNGAYNECIKKGYNKSYCMVIYE